MFGLIVCLFLALSATDGTVIHDVLRRSLDCQTALPTGFPDDIPLSGDPINDGEYFPGFNCTNPCERTQDATKPNKCIGNIFHVSIDGYPRLYYTCHGPQATLYSCPKNTTFDEKISRCIRN